MKNLIIASFLSVLFFITCSTAQSKSSKQDSANLEILEQNVESTDSFFIEGKLYLEKNELDNAMESFNKSNYSQSCFFKAVTLNKLGKTDEALKHFEECINKNVLKDESCYNIAILLYDKGDLESSENVMMRTISINPEHAGAHYFLGNLKYLRNDMKGAIESYKKALEVQPQSIDLWEAVFAVYLQNEDYKNAWEIRENLDKKNTETVLNVLKVAELTGNFITGTEFIPDNLKNDKNISRQTRILLTKGGKFKEAVENGKKELESSKEQYVIIDRNVNGDGSYVIGLNTESLFIVCSQNPDNLIKFDFSGGKIKISNSSENSAESEISNVAESYCQKK